MKLLILLLLPVSVYCQNHYARLDSFMQGEEKHNRFNGNVLVAKGGKVVYKKSFGYRDFNTKEKLDDNSVFELASVSKQFTAMGILKLVENKKLSLSDSLRKFFPELPYHNVTVRHLLTHTSGLPDYMQAMETKWDKKKVAFNDDVIKLLAAERIALDFQPGTKWAYSNTGYQMLASIIEKVSGKTFREYLHEIIFMPLGMSQSRVYNTRRSIGEKIPNYAYGVVYSPMHKKYFLPDSLPAYNMVYYLDGIQGDGIINATTGDLLKWSRALKENTLLTKELQKEMLGKQALTDSIAMTYYGYGVMSGSSPVLGEFIAHSGGWPGYVTNLLEIPAHDITVIVLSNNESASSQISSSLASIMLSKEVVMPYEHIETELDSNQLSRFTGSYKVPGEIKIVKRNNKLYLQRVGRPDIALKAESPTKLFYGNGADRQIEFIFHDDKPVKVFGISKGIRQEFEILQ